MPTPLGLTPLGQTLTRTQPGSMRDLAIMWMETHYEPFGGLMEGVRTGQSAAATYYGQPFFDWLGGHPEQVERFSRAMANLTDGIKLGAVSSCDFTGAGRIIDVGGADGALLALELAQPGGSEPHMAKTIDLTMLGMLSGRERTQAEYRLLLEQAGFAFDAVTATPTPISIVRALA